VADVVKIDGSTLQDVLCYLSEFRHQPAKLRISDFSCVASTALPQILRGCLSAASQVLPESAFERCGTRAAAHRSRS
jgi:hypothetical protein